MKTPLEYGKEAATLFSANNPGHFPGRSLFEGLVTHAVQAALKEWLTRAAQRLEVLADELDEPIIRSAASNVRGMIDEIPDE